MVTQLHFQPTIRTGRSFRVIAQVTLFLWVLLCTDWRPGSVARAQAGQPRQLTLIGPDDSHFDDLLNQYYPGIQSMDGFTGERPYLVILQNNTKVAVEAYCIRYETPGVKTRAAGSGCTRFIHAHFAAQAAKESRVVRPGDIYLLSPQMLNETPTDYLVEQSFVRDALSIESKEAQQAGNPPVTVTADAVIYSDGHYTGADHNHLLQTYQAYRAAERDEAASVLQKLYLGTANKDLVAVLTKDRTDALKADPSPQGNPTALYQNQYLRRRGMEADKLLAIYKKQGQHALKARLNAIVKRPAETITALPGE